MYILPPDFITTSSNFNKGRFSLVLKELLNSVPPVNGAPNTKLYTFALPFYGWDEMADQAGGEGFILTNNSAEMYNNLMSIIDAACLPREMEEQGAMFFRNQYIYASYHIELTCY